MTSLHRMKFGVIVILLHIEWTVGSQCGSPALESKTTAAINCSITCLDWSQLKLKGVTDLSLANCSIFRIVNISHTPGLEQLNLMNNNLQQLPDNLLESLSNLNTLTLNRNPLTSISLSIVLSIQVSFDCSCKLLEDLMHNCNAAENCTQSSLQKIHCSWSNISNVLNVSSFYHSECQGPNLLPVYVLITLLIVIIVGVVGCVLMRQRCQRTASILSPNKRHSVSSSDPGQQRYVSTTTWKDAAESSREGNQQQLAHKDYENMLMGEADGAPGDDGRNPRTVDDTYYLESDPACDIYLNEQPIYCNYTESGANPDDDVYIIPDK
ncbi:uncharacterized protein LOC144479586 [Mustelus asterias]